MKEDDVRIQLSFRIRRDIDREIERLAFETGMKKQEIIETALQKYLFSHGTHCKKTNTEEYWP